MLYALKNIFPIYELIIKISLKEAYIFLKKQIGLRKVKKIYRNHFIFKNILFMLIL